MGDATPSSRGGWNETDELKILFSLLPEKINWANVYVPEGRTKKAVRHRVDALKKRMGELPRVSENSREEGDANNNDETPAVTPKNTKAVPKTPTKKRGRPTKNAEVVKTDDNEGEVQESPTKKTKTTMPDGVEMF